MKKVKLSFRDKIQKVKLSFQNIIAIFKILGGSIGGMILRIGMVILNVIIPLFLAEANRKLVDYISTGNEESVAYLIIPVVSVVCVMLIAKLISLAAESVNEYLVLNMTYKMHKAIYDKCYHIQLRAYDEPELYGKLSIAERISAGSLNDMVSGLFTLITSIAQIVTTALIISKVSPILFVSVIISSLLMIITGKQKISYEQFDKKRTDTVRRMNYYHEISTSGKYTKEIKLFGMIPFTINRYRKYYDEWNKAEIAYSTDQIKMRFVTAPLSTLFVFVLPAFYMMLNIKGNIDGIATFTYYLSIVSLCSGAVLKRLQYIIARYANYSISAFNQCVDEYEQIADKYEKVRLLAMKKSISENHNLYNINYSEETARKLQLMLYELIGQELCVLKKILRELADLHMSESFAYKNIQKVIPDQNGDCVFIDDCYIEGIVLYDYDRAFMGSLIVDENTIRIEDTRAGNVYYYPIHHKISKCIWRPSLPMHDDEDAIMYVVKGWSSTSKYIPSTTYPTDPPFIKADNLGEHADNFWCPDVNDPEPYVELHFETPTIVDTLVVIQHYVERRVAEIQIEAWVDEGWNVISALKQLDGRQIITVKFDTITSEKFKVKFTKRIRSENGFDIPNILYMRVFKDNAS